MEFSTAVNRLGILLAAHLFENELPVDFWQTVTLEQCFSLLCVPRTGSWQFGHNSVTDVHPNTVSSVPTCLFVAGCTDLSLELFKRAKLRFQELLSQGDFEFARSSYKLADEIKAFPYTEEINIAELKDIAYRRMCATAETFKNWWALFRLIRIKLAELRNNHRTDKRQLEYSKDLLTAATKAYEVASVRDHYLIIVNSQSAPALRDLPVEFLYGPIRKLLADKPFAQEIHLGFLFPNDAPEYEQALQQFASELRLINAPPSSDAWFIGWPELYLKTSKDHPLHQEAIGQMKKSAVLNFSVARRCREVAITQNDLDLAEFALECMAKTDDPREQSLMLSIAPIDSEVHKRLAALVASHPRYKRRRA